MVGKANLQDKEKMQIGEFYNTTRIQRVFGVDFLIHRYFLSRKELILAPFRKYYISLVL